MKIKKDYYERNFKKYHEQTFQVDPDSFLEPLTKHLKPGARILDVGCGSGRDLLWFKNKGCTVTGFERSSGLAKLARQNAGCEVVEGDFEHFDFSGFRADAVLLIGSLVHVPHDKMAGVLDGILQSLNAKGHLLITMKEGQDTKSLPDGRIFYLWTHNSLSDLFHNIGMVQLDFLRQASKIRQDDVWLGYVLQKTS